MHLFEDGQRICNDRYLVEKYLGAGKSGEGYCCEDRLLRRKVVCKVALIEDEFVREEFRLQFQRLGEIRSPAVIRPLGFDEHDRRAVVVLEWIGGLDLDRWLPGRALSVRLDALADVAVALNELHEAGLHHGDLWGGVNILADSQRGCVLIDPEPALWGPTSGTGERRSDIESLGYLVRQLAPEYANSRFASMLDTLQRTPDGATLAAVTMQLRTAASAAPFVPGSDETYQAAGAGFQDRVKKVNSVYRTNRLLRSNSIDGLAAMAREEAKPFGLEVHLSPGHDQRESERDLQGTGWFSSRHLHCCLQLNERACFTITFDAIEDFYKPWPYGGGTLAVGKWRVDGVRSGAGRIELTVIDGVAGFMADNSGQDTYPPPHVKPSDREKVAIDVAWIRRRIADLTGTELG